MFLIEFLMNCEGILCHTYSLVYHLSALCLPALVMTQRERETGEKREAEWDEDGDVEGEQIFCVQVSHCKHVRLNTKHMPMVT